MNMRRSVSIIIGILFLVVVGVASLMAGRFERRMAIAQEDMAVLDFADPQADYAALEQDIEGLPLVSERPLREIRRRRAMLQYWQADYADLVEVARTASQAEDADSIDPEMRVLAANALYRVAQRGPQDRPTLLKNLDAAIRAYNEALRAGVARPDVAFNYELAVRMRDEVGAGKRKQLTNAKTDDTESDPNMHGDPGEPPKDMKVEQFQIRIPMDPKEIKQSQEQAAGTGAARRKRG
jgi:DNA-binding XRE family transcriptional regulator